MRGRTRGVLVTLTALVLSVAVSPASAAQRSSSAAPTSGGLTFSGDAYGTYGFVGNTVVTGKSAWVTLGCLTPAGVTHSNNVAGVNLPLVLITGAIDTSVATKAANGVVRTSTSADIQDVKLLSGLITASEVKAASATSHNSTGFHFSTSGSSLVNLVIDGHPITVAPAPNTTIDLPRVGKVVLNEQIKSLDANRASLTVNMIHVHVTTALLGIAKGTQFIVGHATSGLVLTSRAASLGGGAYGSLATLADGTVTSGKTWPVAIPCGGTNGNVITNAAAGVNVPNVISTGTISDTAQGTIDAISAIGETTSTVQSVNLGGGLVTVDAVKADAHASLIGGAVNLDDAGSNFVNLVVNGQSISGTPPANTKIPVGNITVWLHRVIRSSSGITVRMIEITVKGSNPLNLPIGSDIQVAAAGASVVPVTPAS